MKTLSIIIPYHNEDLSILNYPMSSLNTQVGVDWNDIEIIISNNCEKPKDINEWLKQFIYIYPHIRYVECPIKAGMGQNRQFGISVSTGKYIMFSDCDDTLISPIALKTMMDEIYSDKYSVISGKVIREVVEAGSDPVICDMSNGTLLLHGKAYRKDFIIKYGIHFSSYIFAYEDFFFNLLSNTFSGVCANGMKLLNDSIYTWRAREESISSEMGSNNYTTVYYKDSIAYLYYASMHLIDYGVKGDDLNRFLINSVCNIYASRMASPKDDKLTLAVANLIVKLLPKDKSELKKIIHDVNSKVTTLETIEDWIDRVYDYDNPNLYEEFGLSPYKKFEY